MNIRTKLVLGLLIVLCLNLGVGFYALWQQKEQSQRAAQILALSIQIVETSLSAQVHFKKQVQEWKNVLLRGHDPDLYDKYLSQFYDQERKTREMIEALIPLISEHREASETAKEFLFAHIRLGHDYREAFRYYSTVESKPYIMVDKQVRGIDRQPTDLLDDVVHLTHLYKKRRLTELESTTSEANIRILIIMLGTLIASIAFAIWLIDRNIGQHLTTATEFAKRITSGDFSGDIAVQGKDEAAQMLSALKTMKESLERYRETLRKSEERTRLLLNSTGEGIYGVDKDGRCTFCNPAGLEMLGYASDSELLGKEIHALMHHSYPDGRPYPVEESQASQAYREGRSAHVDDEVFWRLDGSSFPVEYRSFPIRHGDELLGAVVTFADIMERKQVENNLKEAHAALATERAALAERVEKRTEELRIANAELARSARAKDEFLAAMSHELRTPLTSILGNSEILIDQLKSVLNERQQKALMTVEESANHLLSLINDILDVAKVAAGKMTLMWDDVPIRQLCEASLRLIQRSAEDKALRVSSHIDPDVQIMPGDSRRLKQLLVNLLSNAVKFTPEGGEIGLEVTGKPDLAQVWFTVWDNGIGIKKADLERLFKPFVQLDSRLTRQYSGTGLGLALVDRMAELHGGKVAVQSTPGKGSRFTVQLPWDPQSSATHSGTKQRPLVETKSPVAASSYTGATVLIAEDDNAIMAMLRDYLEAVGYSVITAGDGREAVSKTQAAHPDAILMDIQMPGVDGLEAIAEIREVPEFDKTPVIALTALAMPDDRERCLKAGADDYLGKPVGLKELHHKIDTWLQRV